MEAFVFGGGFVGEVGEALGGEAGDFVEFDGGCGGEGIADEEVVISDEADDIASVGIIDGFAVAGEEAL